MHNIRTTFTAGMALAALATGVAGTTAVAGTPDADRQPDTAGDVVRTYADGHVSTGYGKSDIRSARLAVTRSPGGGAGKSAVTVAVHLTEVDAEMLRKQPHLTVRWTTSTGHVARTVTRFTAHGTHTTIRGLDSHQCAAYPGIHPKRDALTIALANDSDCWPGAMSVRARVWVRYDFSPQGRARDVGPRLGPVATP